MKIKFMIVVSALFACISTFAQGSSLYVKNEGELIDVETLIDQEEDVYSSYGFDNFCYQGNGDTVIKKMKGWAKDTEYFFSGGGGGFVLRNLILRRGIATYDIEMRLEDEVVPGEIKSVIIKPCT